MNPEFEMTQRVTVTAIDLFLAERHTLPRSTGSRFLGGHRRALTASLLSFLGSPTVSDHGMAL